MASSRVTFTFTTAFTDIATTFMHMVFGRCRVQNSASREIASSEISVVFLRPSNPTTN